VGSSEDLTMSSDRLKVLNLVQEKTLKLSHVTEHSIELKTNHTLSGNPTRCKVGTIELRLDEEWKVNMKRLDRNVVTALTLPLLYRYGYIGKGRIPK
jgi:hypothetical protein